MFVHAVSQPHRAHFTSAPKGDNVKCLAVKKKNKNKKILKPNLSVLLTLGPWVNVPSLWILWILVPKGFCFNTLGTEETREGGASSADWL